MAMFMRGLGRGLGDVFPSKAGGGAHVAPTTSSGPSFYIEPRGPYGFTSFGVSTTWINYLTKLGARVNATISAIRDSGAITTPYPASSLVGCNYQKSASYVDVLNPPGVIDLFGVMFSVEELGAGKLERTFTPNDEQRLLIDYAIYAKSQAVVAGMIRGTMHPVSIKIGAASVMERNPTAVVFQAWADRENNASVQDFTQAENAPEDRLTTWLDDYSLNPIQPNEDELKNSGGLRRYYERGGYLLSRRVAYGRMPLDATGVLGLHWNTGYYVCPRPGFALQVGQSGNRYAKPEDYVGGIPVPALFYHSAEGVGWNVKIIIGPQYTMTVTPKDPGTGQKILGGIATIMQKFRELLCSVFPLVQPIVQQQLIAEICVDANGKTCAKGSSSFCTCTPPTAGQKDAVAMTSALVNGVCAMGVDAPPTNAPPQQISPPPIDPQVDPKPIPWWAVALGGLGIGMALFARRPTPPR